MTDPMTDARLAEIERRWRAVGLTSWAAFCDEQEYPNTNIVAFKHRTQLICSIPGADKRDSVPVFIESAIEDVPALVAEVRRLREENERLRAEAGKLERERNASIAVCEGLSRTQGCPPMPPGAIVVRDDDETRDRIAQALMTRAAWSPETLSELVNSNQSCLQLAAMRLRADADAVLDALREAYQRGEQDSRGDPRCPTCRCLRMDVPRSAATCLFGCHPEGGAK